VNTKKSRLAPSPTGALHLGNAFAFVVNWALATKNDWELLFRMEDLDGPRKKMETIQESTDILRWLGLDWNGSVHIQSEDLTPCKSALEILIQKNKAYHCQLTRAEISEASQAPHAMYDATGSSIRPINIKTHNDTYKNQNTNWRFSASGATRTIHDELRGEITFQVEEDFVIWTKSNMPSYQLAVVVDDHRQGVTDVVRGSDLLQSASWQEEIYETLGWQKPRWWHLPLIVGQDGKRLAKRHGDSRISTYKTLGVPSERIIGLIAMWCGVTDKLLPLQLETIIHEFSLENMQHSNITFSQKEEQWLLDS
jgi:glutamyl-tRNA synthetase